MKVNTIYIFINGRSIDVSDYVVSLDKINLFYRKLDGSVGSPNFKFVLNFGLSEIDDLHERQKVTIFNEDSKYLFTGYIEKLDRIDSRSQTKITVQHEFGLMKDLTVWKDSLNDEIDKVDGLLSGTFSGATGTFKWVQAFKLLDVLLDLSGVGKTIYTGTVYDETVMTWGGYGARYYKNIKLDINMIYCSGLDFAQQCIILDDGAISFYTLFFEVVKQLGLILRWDIANGRYTLERLSDLSYSTETDNNITSITTKQMQNAGYIVKGTANNYYANGILDYYSGTKTDLETKELARIYEPIKNTAPKINFLSNVSVGDYDPNPANDEFIDFNFEWILTPDDTFLAMKYYEDTFSFGSEKKKIKSLDETIGYKQAKDIRLKQWAGYEIEQYEIVDFKITANDKGASYTFTSATKYFDLTFTHPIDVELAESIVTITRSTIFYSNVTIALIGANQYRFTITSSLTNQNSYYINLPPTVLSNEGQRLNYTSTHTDYNARIGSHYSAIIFNVNIPV